MTDVISRLANRRCPECDAVQPFYAGASYQRGPDDVVACPGCGIPLRLAEARHDPGGVGAASVMIVGLTASVLGTAFWAAEAGLSEGALGLMVAGIVTLALIGGFVWGALSARGRQVEKVEPIGKAGHS